MKKKQDNKYKRSFAKRLTWRITLILLLVMGVTAALIFGAAMETIYAESDIFCQTLLKDKSREAHQILSDIYVASKNTVPEIEENLDKPDKLFDIMERIVRFNPLIRSCGISFIEGYYPKKGRLFCPYAIRRDSTTIERLNLNDSIHDYLDQPWFLNGLEAKEGYWSSPFFDEVDKETPLVSYLVPIHDRNGRTVGVFGADLSLIDMEDELIDFKSEKIQEKAEELKKEGIILEDVKMPDDIDRGLSVYYFIIDSAGTYLLHPEMSRVNRKNYFSYAKESPDTIITHLGKMMTAGKKGSYNSTEEEIELKFGRLAVNAYYRPIKHTDWSICLVVPTLIINIIGYVLGGLLAFLVLIGIIVVFFVGRHTIKRASKPLRQLAASADEVAKGNFDTPLPMVKSHDEIHLLRDSFEQMQHSLTQYVDELKSTTAQKASIESELKIAHRIQMSMLPKTFPPYPERNDIDIYGLLTPAKAVGGDLFDFFIRDEHLFFCIGDVTGKGVPASLFMAVTRSLFRNVSSRVSRPEIIVKTLNDAMSENNEMNMFVTLFVGVLDLSTGMLDYCNAGHDAPLLIGDGVSTLPCYANLPVGAFPGSPFACQQTIIKPQTTIFLYTDGLNEAENVAHDQFGDDRIRQLAEQLSAEHKHQPQLLIEQMEQAVHSFVGQAEQSDDLTILAIQYKKVDS